MAYTSSAYAIFAFRKPRYFCKRLGVAFGHQKAHKDEKDVIIDVKHKERIM